MCIKKKVFGLPPLSHKNYFGNVGLAISGDIDLNCTCDLYHISYRILCFSVVAFTINFFFATSIFCSIFSVPGTLGSEGLTNFQLSHRSNSNCCLYVTHCAGEVWTSGNQNWRPWIQFFLRMYACMRSEKWSNSRACSYDGTQLVRLRDKFC